jgi:nitroimidazol reductase NimA-like FMN-containing flavoprotein (pyridoxamine 5'-phosphate oxidase superfamily)
MDRLSEEECWELLGSSELARIAFAAAGDVEIFPVNAVVDRRTIVFCTAEGTKLAGAAVFHRVAVEADGLDPETGLAWSVVLKGDAEVLEDFNDIYAAQELPLHPWHPGFKDRFVRVKPRDIQGRRFLRIVGDTAD